MKKIINILPILTLSLFISCDDSILDKKPLGQISDASVWQDLALVELQVNDIYDDLPDGFNRGWYMLAAATDDGENSYVWPSGQAFNRGDYDASNYPMGGTWNGHYSAIRKANEFFSRIDQVPDSDGDLGNRLKGEVGFLRAYFYFDLSRHYGGVPLITTPQGLDEDLLVSRNNYEECVDFVVAELDKAAALLPDSHSGSNVGRATKGAALALKGRVLLYAERWAQSAQASKDVMDMNYALFGDYEGIFHSSNENNDEVVFDIQFNEPDRSHWAQLFNGVNGHVPGGWGGTSPTQELVDSYELTDGELYSDSPLYDANSPYDNRDPRFYASIIYDGAVWTGSEVQTRLGGVGGIGFSGDATKTGYYMRKFMEEDFQPSIGSLGASNNWILIRYAEVLLNYAEAQNEEAGPDATVYDAVNQVRARVSMPPLPAGLSQSEMRDRIRRERRVELAFEEHRFWDVRRWRIADDVLNKPIHGMRIGPNGEFSGTGPNGETLGRFEVENRVFESRHYLAPIPQGEIDKNSNLTQNPNW
ncbi:RagB/SusD family nutrient uptake outer membrane protein [Splendidivirga corallicola]